jgi:CDP-diacylglycerol--glycerol-3-phosphate 3-phosphatidyltransferase
VAIVFIVRGAIVDTIRHTAVPRGTDAYGLLRSPWSRMLVAGRFMRGLYGTVKAVTFAWALLLQPMPMLYPDAWAVWGGTASAITMTLVLASVALCIIRGLPVLAEFIAEHKVITKSEISLGR